MRASATAAASRWRQELREAQSAYREIGAPGQVQRIEQELAE